MIILNLDYRYYCNILYIVCHYLKVYLYDIRIFLSFLFASLCFLLLKLKTTSYFIN